MTVRKGSATGRGLVLWRIGHKISSPSELGSGLERERGL
jgi:hypothetical protein